MKLIGARRTPNTHALGGVPILTDHPGWPAASQLRQAWGVLAVAGRSVRPGQPEISVCARRADDGGTSLAPGAWQHPVRKKIQEHTRFSGDTVSGYKQGYYL